jgi:hypothetical protein
MGFDITLVYAQSAEFWKVVELSLHELLCMVYHWRFAYQKVRRSSLHSNTQQCSCDLLQLYNFIITYIA